MIKPNGESAGGQRAETRNSSDSRFSRLVRGESEQSVAGHSCELAVAGIGVEHASGRGGACGVERAAIGLDAVDRFVFAHGIKVPNQASVRGAESAQMSVQGARKNGARNHRNGGHLSGAATGFTQARRLGRRSVPDLFAGWDEKGEEPSAVLRFAALKVGK